MTPMLQAEIDLQERMQRNKKHLDQLFEEHKEVALEAYELMLDGVIYSCNSCATALIFCACEGSGFWYYTELTADGDVLTRSAWPLYLAVLYRVSTNRWPERPMAEKYEFCSISKGYRFSK